MTGAASLGYRRGALWGLLVTKLLGAWGLTWDIQWHLTIGRDTFWIPPHLMIYSSVVGGLVLGSGVLVLEWRGRVAPARGFRLATLGLVLVVLAAPIDDLWHRLFGIDVTLWSPPHLLALFGSAVSTLGCVLIATEVYPLGSLKGRSALVLASGVLYGGIRVTLDPSWLVAYSHGGVLFHTFTMLAALALPLALVTAARVSGMRWAPVFAVVVSFAVGVGGQQVARAGFGVFQPASFIEEEIARDPSSALAAGREIAEKNRTVPATAWPLRLSLSLLPAALMASADPRRRPGVATIVYGLGYVHRLRLVSHEPASLRAARASCERDRDGSATHGGVRRRRRPRVALALRPPGGRRARPARRAAPAPGDLRRLSESPGQVSDRR